MDENGNYYCESRNVEKFAEIRSTLPIMVELDRNSGHPGGPVAGQTRVRFRN